MTIGTTLTLTIGATPYVLNRLNQDNRTSEWEYLDSLGRITAVIRQSKDKIDKDGQVMRRHNLYVERIVYPTPTTAMEKYSAAVTFRQGDYNAPGGGADLLKAVNVLLAASSSAMITDLSIGLL